MNLFTTSPFNIHYLSNVTPDSHCPVNFVICDCDNTHFLGVNSICNMDIQPNQTSFGILDLLKVSEIPGSKDPMTLFGRSTRFSGIVIGERIANPATNCCAGYSFNQIGGEWR